MSARKTLAIIGLLLLSGVGAALLTQGPAAGPHSLPAAPAWNPLEAIRTELLSRDPAGRIEGGRHANDYGDPGLGPALLAALTVAEAAWLDPQRPAPQREMERRVRITLVAALCRLEGPEGVAHSHHFLADTDPMVRRAAVVTAGKRRIAVAPDVMRALLTDPHPQVQIEAATAVGAAGMFELAKEVHAGTASGPAAPRMLLATALLGGDDAATVIGRALRDPARCVPAGEAAVIARDRAGIIKELRRALAAPEEPVRRVAADVLRRIGGDITTHLALTALQDESPFVRRLASELLAKDAGDAERTAILTVLTAETDWAVVRDLARALQRLAMPGDAATIAAVARRAPDAALAPLMAALGRCGGPEALAALSELAAREGSEAARGIAEAGGVRFDPTLVPAITPLFHHGHYTVQAAALRAAARAGDHMPEPWRAACEALMASKAEPLRRAATRTLAAVDAGRAAAVLLRHTADADPHVAAGAWQCLPELQGEPGRAAVREALARGRRNNVPARFAAQAAIALELPGGGPLIAALLQRPIDAPNLDTLALHAIARALGRLGGDTEVAALLPLLQHDDRELRSIAAESLFRLLGAQDADFTQSKLMPLRLPYWARRWWADNQGKAPDAWSRPKPPAVPTL